MDEPLLANLERLAALQLQGDEREGVRRDLTRILGHMAALEALESRATATADEPTLPPLRDDQPHVGLPRELALAAAPEHDEQSFLVPRILP